MTSLLHVSASKRPSSKKLNPKELKGGKKQQILSNMWKCRVGKCNTIQYNTIQYNTILSVKIATNVQNMIKLKICCISSKNVSSIAHRRLQYSNSVVFIRRYCRLVLKSWRSAAFCSTYEILCVVYCVLCVVYCVLCVVYPVYCKLYPLYCIVYGIFSHC